LDKHFPLLFRLIQQKGSPGEKNGEGMEEKRMKKMMAGLMLFLAVFCLAGASMARAAVRMETAEVGNACVFDGALYMIEEGKLVRYASPEAKAETVADLMSFSEMKDLDEWEALNRLYLAENGERLYLIRGSTGDVFTPENGELRKVVRVRLEGVASKQNGEVDKYNLSFSAFAVAGNELYAHIMDTDAWQEYFCAFSLETGERRNIPAESDLETWKIARYGERLMTLKDTTGELVAMDPQTGAAEEVLRMVGDTSATGFAQDGEYIWYVSGSRVIRSGKEGNEAADQVPLDLPGGAGIWNGQYVAVSDGKVYVTGGETAEKTREVNILGLGGILNRDIAQAFMEENPGVIVNVTDSDEDSLQTLTSLNLAGDDSADLFLLSNYRAVPRDIAGKGYAAEIQSEKLGGKIRKMLPSVADFLQAGGKLYGVPAGLYVKYWNVRKDLTGGGAPETFVEYLDMMLGWYDSQDGTTPAYTFDGCLEPEEEWKQNMILLLAHYVYSHQTEDAPLSFNTPEFRAALEQLNRLSEKNVMIPGNAENVPAAFTVSEISPFERALNEGHEGEESVLPPVFGTEKPVVQAQLDYFILNPNSRNASDAVLFLEYYVAHLDEVTQYTLYPDKNDPVEQEDWSETLAGYQETAERYRGLIAEDEKNLELVAENSPYREELRQGIQDSREKLSAVEEKIANEEGRWVYSPEMIAEYRAIAPYLGIEKQTVVNEITVSLDAVSILMKSYYASAAADQVIAEMDERMRMMFYEGF